MDGKLTYGFVQECGAQAKPGDTCLARGGGEQQRQVISWVQGQTGLRSEDQDSRETKPKKKKTFKTKQNNSKKECGAKFGQQKPVAESIQGESPDQTAAMTPEEKHSQHSLKTWLSLQDAHHLRLSPSICRGKKLPPQLLNMGTFKGFSFFSGPPLNWGMLHTHAKMNFESWSII